MTALKSRKKILAAARLAQYKEHLNDHQTQLLETFEKQGYLIYMGDDWQGKFDDLKDIAEVVYLPRTEGISTTKIKQDLEKLGKKESGR